MCDMCGIVSSLRPESSYWRKMCEYITGSHDASFQDNGCTASSDCDFFEKTIAGNKCFVIFSGKLTNYDRIRYNLQKGGVVFEGESVAELVFKSYFAFGVSCFKNFHGKFAAVIWNGCERELTLFRDKIGFKQLFYYFDGFRLVFASKISDILRFPFVKKEFCDDIYCKLFTLAGSRLEFDTLFNKIYEVPHSGYVTYKDCRIKVMNYYMFNVESTTDNFAQTISGLDFLLGKKVKPNIMTEKIMTKDELGEKIKEYVKVADFPSPYIDLNELSNLKSNEKFQSSLNLFTIPKRFKLPVKNCEKADREFVNDFLSTIPAFSYKDEKDIIKKEELYIKMSVVLPQVIAAKSYICENVEFPYLKEEVFEYCIKSVRYKEKLVKTYFGDKKPKPVKENIRVLKLLFNETIADKNSMLGFIRKEELLKFTRLFPRPETMLYLLQVNTWLNMFL